MIRLSHDQLAFAIDVSNAGPAGLVLRPSSEGVVAMPSGVVELIYVRGWLATLTPLGRSMILALKKKDAEAVQ